MKINTCTAMRGEKEEDFDAVMGNQACKVLSANKVPMPMSQSCTCAFVRKFDGENKKFDSDQIREVRVVYHK